MKVPSQQAGRQFEPQNSEQSKPSLSSNFNLVYICCYVDVYSNHVFASKFGRHQITTKDEETWTAERCCFNSDR